MWRSFLFFLSLPMEEVVIIRLLKLNSAFGNFWKPMLYGVFLNFNKLCV